MPGTWLDQRHPEPCGAHIIFRKKFSHMSQHLQAEALGCLSCCISDFSFSTHAVQTCLLLYAVIHASQLGHMSSLQRLLCAPGV